MSQLEEFKQKTLEKLENEESFNKASDSKKKQLIADVMYDELKKDDRRR